MSSTQKLLDNITTTGANLNIKLKKYEELLSIISSELKEKEKKYQQSKKIYFQSKIQYESVKNEYDMIIPLYRNEKAKFNQNIQSIINAIKESSLYLIYSNEFGQDILILLAQYSFGFVDDFDSIRKHPSLILRDKQIVKQYTNEHYAFRVNMKNIMFAGIHFIEFIIKKCDTWISFGISKSNDASFKYVGFGKSYSLNQDGKIYYNAKSTPYLIGEKLKNDDIIGIYLDLNKYELHFFVNGINRGKAFDIEPANYCFAISLYVANSCVCLLK